MKLKLLFFFFIFGVGQFHSQCPHYLLMDDSYGDGWNGFSVNILVNGNEVLSGVTLNFGSSDFVEFSVNQGDEIIVEVNTTGQYDNEVSYSIYDADTNEVASGNANDEISSGELFAVCPALLENAIEIINLPFLDFDASTDISPIANGWSNLDCSILNLPHRSYVYQPSTTVNLGIDIDNGDSDSFIQVYVPGTDLFEYNELQFYSNDTCDNSTSKSINLLAGETYYILIGNPNNSTNISFYDNDNNDIINIPDANLKSALLNTNCNSLYTLDFDDFFLNIDDPFYSSNTNLTDFDLDINNDGELQFSEALMAQQLNLSDFEITSLEGLQFFNNLKALYVGSNNISDISQLQDLDLEVLSCPDNQFTNLDLSQNQELLALNCSQNLQLANINVTQCNELQYFICHHYTLEDNTVLQTVDLTNNTELVNVNINGTNITSFDFSNNPQLVRLNLTYNELDNLDISNNPELTTLICSDNNLTELGTSQNPELRSLFIRRNNLTSLDVSQSVQLTEMACSYNELTTLDISQNALMWGLECSNNNLESIDMFNNTPLFLLNCSDNLITDLDLSQIPNLSLFSISNNLITELDLSQNLNLSSFSCRNNLLTSLDLSNNSNLNSFYISNSVFLNTVNFQNGNNENVSDFSTSGCTNLQTICVDDIAFAITNFTDIEPQTIFVEDCTATSINYNLISGVVTFDDESNGCDTSDLPVTNVMVTTTDGVNEFATFTQDDGSYLIDVVDTMYSTSVNLPLYFTSTPDPATSDFNGFGETDTQDFCVTGNQAFDDFEVSFIPLQEARPGFNTNYQLVYENRGVSTIPNGSIELQFNDIFQQFVSASPSENGTTANTITFNYTNLLPFESRSIDVTLNTFQPPTVESGDVLNFTAIIEPIASDNESSNNTFIFTQDVVNSYDPNDITVLQGESILIDEANKDLDYVIRFQNTGTASAINVVITHMLDSDLDFSSFRPISSSHDYRVQISNGDFVEFIFENINLPDIISDEENSQGFIAFKIKPKSDAVVGDEFTGFADIYFDFNSPIQTNTAFTEIVEPLSIDEFDSNNLIIYPNPTSSILNIENSYVLTEITIYDLNGRLIKTQKLDNVTTNYQLDVNEISKGIYFLEVKSDNSKQTLKFIKN